MVKNLPEEQNNPLCAPLLIAEKNSNEHGIGLEQRKSASAWVLNENLVQIQMI